MKVLLISNYLPDQQESMQRFATMLERGLTELGHEVCLIRPTFFFGRLKPGASGLGKWLGYLDKFLVFPFQLRQAVAWADVVHVCDHSNAFYTKYLQDVPHLVTCHDLLALRGALGEDTNCPASPVGKILQRWILKGLQRTRMAACDSSYTKRDLERLTKGNLSLKNIRLILLGLNYSYQRLASQEVVNRLIKLQNFDYENPFILHVGSSLKRKNRDGAIRIFTKIKNEWNGQLVFAGSALTPDLEALIEQFNLSDRVVQIVKPDNDLLEALYNKAFALLFPSRFEGFGWPILEAQACGCPVLCSDRTSLPEVAGEAALIRSVDDEDGFATDILRLTNPQEREFWVQKGLINVRRFTPEKMIKEYEKLYQELYRDQ